MPFTDPVALFNLAQSHLNREDWLGAARLCDPVSLRAFKREMLQSLAPSVPHPVLTPEEYMKLQPDLPREVAEYQANEHARLTDPARRLRDELPGITSPEQLRSMEPAEIFAAWLEGRSPRAQIARLVEQGHVTAEVGATIAAHHMPPRRYVALGAVPDGEHLAHVVFRDASEPWLDIAAQMDELPQDERALSRQLRPHSFARLAPCLRQPDGTWRLVADHRFMGVTVGQIFGVGTDAPGPEVS